MLSLNKVFIAGRLTKKPNLRKTPSGSSVCDLLVALNREYINNEGETICETCFVDVVVWGKQAEICCEFLDVSSPVLIEGRLQLDVWYTKEEEKRCRLRVVAERVQFIERKSSAESVTFKETSALDEKSSPLS